MNNPDEGAVNSERATIFVMDGGKAPSEDYLRVMEWFQKWDDSVAVFGYSTGVVEYTWDMECGPEAFQEIPDHFKTYSAWLERAGSDWKL